MDQIYKNKPSEVFEAICINCMRRFIAVVPVGTKLIDMQCKACGVDETIIRTGEYADRLDE